MRGVLLFAVLVVGVMLATAQINAAPAPAPAPAPTPAMFGGRSAWYAPLSSAEEVPRNNSTATGTATFQTTPQGNALQYWLDVQNLQNIQQAHIHIGAAGQNGP